MGLILLILGTHNDANDDDKTLPVVQLSLEQLVV